MPGRPARVLVGDEEPLVCDFIRDALGFSGFEVEVSHDEAGLLRRARERAFGLLLLDFSLASRSAFQGIIALREREPEMPIILMAGAVPGHPEPASFAVLYRVQLLRKPFGLRGLREAVQRAMPRDGC